MSSVTSAATNTAFFLEQPALRKTTANGSTLTEILSEFIL